MKTYSAKDHARLRSKFPNSEAIGTNYSQTFQDMFVLTMLKGKRDGYFLEIGANHPVEINNTYLLETVFGWRGISIDIEKQYETLHREAKRTNTFITGDALKIDYKRVLGENNFPKQIDYLQIDIDPATQSLKCLQMLPLTDYKFSIITFETDVYQGCHDQVKNESRRILGEHDYVLVAGNISNVGHGDPYEDWWVDPTVIDPDLISLFLSKFDLNIPGDELLLA
jgi:hypothetical protein